MTQNYRTAVLPALVVACVSVSGDNKNQGNGAMTPVSPAVTENITPGARIDLPNSASLPVATIGHGASCTPLD
jgi:hypothetical protein